MNEDFAINNGTLEQYKGRASVIVGPPEVKQINAYVFGSKWGFDEIIEEIRIPFSVETIVTRAVINCLNLKHLVIEGSPEIIQNPESMGKDSIIFGRSKIRTAGPAGTNCGYDYEFGWSESIPDGAFSAMASITLPEGLKVLSRNAVLYGEKTHYICPGMTFSLLPSQYKMSPALECLRGEAELDPEQWKAIIPYIKKTKKKLLEKLLLDNSSAGVSKLLKLSTPSIEEIDEYLEKAAMIESPEITAVLLNYKNEAFSAKRRDAYIETEQEKAIGNKERSLSDWRKVFRISDDGETCSIQKYKLTEESVIIPERIAGKKVVSLGSRAFSDNEAIKEIVLPESIAEIGEEAFKNCSGLEKIDLPKKLKKIGLGAFQNCKALLKIQIPEKVQQIQEKAFSGCRSLESVELPSGLRIIGQQAFESCENLRAIAIPESIKKIEYGTFQFCKNLTEIGLPDEITEIGTSSFAYCAKLSLDSLPEKLIKIDNYAFSECESITISHVPDGVAYLGCEAFKGCKMIETMSLPDSMEVIRFGAFSDCTGLREIEIPDTLSTLEHSVFKGCNRLVSIIIPSKVKKLGGSLFADCTALQSVKILNPEAEMSDKTFGVIDERVKKIEIIVHEGSAAALFARKKGMNVTSL